jgi:thymidylate kinase
MSKEGSGTVNSRPRVENAGQRDTKPTRQEVVSNIVERIDAALEAPVLVLGSFPPAGRDLELLVRPPELRAVKAHLTAEGLCRRGFEWARFFDCSVYSVELVPAERLCLPPTELVSLFDEARLIVGPLSLTRLRRPAPHHVLLLQARRLVRDGALAPKRRPRIDRALAEDAEAWTLAAARAPQWGLRRALDLLHDVYEGDLSVPRVRRWRAFGELLASAGGAHERAELFFRSVKVKLPRRNRIVTISGLDGAGKSFQAVALQETLERLVMPSVVEWMPLGHNPALHVLRLPKRLLRADESMIHPAMLDGSVPDSPARRWRERSALFAHAWATIVVLANVVAHRRATFHYPWRGRVVIHDRYTCDSASQLHFWYGERRPYRFQKWLLKALSPKPLCSFFLDVSPEVALIRKGEYTLVELRRQAQLYRNEYRRVGARRLDAELPPAELCAEIAAEVWTSIPLPSSTQLADGGAGPPGAAS